MGAATAAAGRDDRDEVAVKKKGPKAPGPPWWIYVAVAGVVIFCLFPFYWLVNISLKTGAGPVLRGHHPAQPDAGELQVDLPERRLHASAGQQRRS